MSAGNSVNQLVVTKDSTANPATETAWNVNADAFVPGSGKNHHKNDSILDENDDIL